MARMFGGKGTAVLFALATLASVGCKPIQQQVILALQAGSDVTITSQFGFPPPLTTHLEGSLSSTLTIQIRLLDLLLGRPIPATVSIDDVRIAGSPVQILSFLSSGIICVNKDESAPSGGTASIDLKHGVLTLNASASTIISITDPDARALVGPAGADISFPVTVNTTSPVNIFDLLGALSGQVFPISFAQEVNFTIPLGVPVFEGGTITGTLFFKSVAAVPSSDQLTFCDGFTPS